MDKEHIDRVTSWNDFKRNFPVACSKIEKLNKQIKSGNIYHSSEYNDPKKSGLVLSFIEKPINVYKKEDGALQVETQKGCRLFYELEYNGNIHAYIKDYDNNDYQLKMFSSASKIKENNIKNHIDKFLLVELNTSKISQPKFFDKLKFILFKSIQQQSTFEIIKIIISQLPIIKQIVKTLENNK